MPLLAVAVAVIVALIRATAQQGRELDARAGLPQAPKSSPLAWILSLLGCLGSVVLGAVIVVTGSDQGGPAGKGTTNLGVFFVVTGLVAVAARLVAGLLRVTRGQRAAYRRWLASLTPQERAAVYAAQAAGLMAAHQGLRRSNERARARREAARARHDYISRFMNATMNHRPFDEPPPPGMSGSWRG